MDVPSFRKVIVQRYMALGLSVISGTMFTEATCVQFCNVGNDPRVMVSKSAMMEAFQGAEKQPHAA